MNEKQPLTRREFQAGVGSVLLGGALVAPLASENVHATDTASACDFQSSFMTWDLPYRKDSRPHARHNIPHGNMARIQLDALIDVIELDSGAIERFVLIAPCRTEWVYAENRLFQLPSGEYRNIYSLTEERPMGREITFDGKTHKGHPVSDSFRALKIDFRTYSPTRRLTTPKQIVEATAANAPLVGRTSIESPDGKWRLVLEYPIKTMNFQPKTDSFQVDTGPLLVSDFQSPAERAIDRLEMAHVAYNRLDRAEFILRRPTPVRDAAGAQLCEVLHYSEVHEHAAENVILAGSRK